MSYSVHREESEKKDRIKSLVLTLLISILTLIALYFYQFKRLVPADQIITTMLINFGDNQNGDGAEEPMNQEGSVSSVETEVTTEPQVESRPTPNTEEKVILGTNKKNTVAKVEPKKTPEKKVTTPVKTPTKKTSTTTSKTAAAKTASGDAKGTAAVGNLIRGRGTAQGSQGTGGTTGNEGDPLGGTGNGDSKIGVDRKLIAFIPGTMGRGGAQPSHNCSGTGTITVAYTVDKSGNVTSARRSSGISDPCVSSTSVAWVKQYVKAEKSTTSSTGTYRITF